jgi:hypothetical protein
VFTDLTERRSFLSLKRYFWEERLKGFLYTLRSQAGERKPLPGIPICPENRAGERNALGAYLYAQKTGQERGNESWNI